MNVRDSVPNDALTYWHQRGRKEGEYSFWRRQELEGEDWVFKWYWAALGKVGVEDTVEDAQQAAKDWIEKQVNGRMNGSVQKEAGSY